MNKDLYLLVDGTHADPSDCDLGADHELRHANGVPVALHEDGTPMTITVGAVENKNVLAVEIGEEAVAVAEQQVADEAAASEQAGATVDGVETLIDPATGQPAEGKAPEPVTSRDMAPEPKPVPAPKATYKTRGKPKR